MEGVLPEVRCQIIVDFYGKNVSTWKMFTIRYLRKIKCKKIVIYGVMQLVDAGESVTQKEGRVS